MFRSWKFDVEKVDGDIYYEIQVYVPPSVKNENNVTLMFYIKKRTMKTIAVIPAASRNRRRALPPQLASMLAMNKVEEFSVEPQEPRRVPLL